MVRVIFCGDDGDDGDDDDGTTVSCLERKSAPMVALYCPVNLLEWYLFMSDVLPTLKCM